MGSTNESPQIFEQYFEMGKQETLSPFITKNSRDWGKNLPVRTALLSAFFLTLSFLFSYSEATLPVSNSLLLAVYFLAGVPSLIDSIEDLLNFEVNIDMLMTLAAFSSVLIGSGMEGGLLLVLFALAGSMEQAVTAKAKSAIKSLTALSPTTATVVCNNGRLTQSAVREVEVNALILVKSGEVIPLDGVVEEGCSSVNLVHLTGENFPIRKEEGDTVPAGGRNLEGALKIRVKQTSANSTLAKIIQLVTEAHEAKPKLQRWFDRLSRTYALTIISLSAFFSLLFPLLFHMPFLGQEGALYRSLSFLIAASPCALIIALPIAYLSAISVCARNGILLKGGATLDDLARCTLFAFDKTGTLTTGELRAKAPEPFTDTDISPQEAFQVAYTLEQNTIHPIAQSVVKEGEKQALTPLPLSQFKTVPGSGVEGIVTLQNKSYPTYMGRPDPVVTQLPADKKAALNNRLQQIRQSGELIAVLTIDEAIFLFCFTDTPRDQIKRTLNALKSKWGLQLMMLTGDHQENAARTAKLLHLDDFQADLSPEDKLLTISRLAKNTSLAMVGDGINDAPALARATVGICMGQVGTTTAMDASDIILLQDNIELLDWLFGKARETQRIVRQNLSIAAGAIACAALPALFGFVPLWLAVILHEGGTILVGLNALRLFRK